MGYRSEVAYVIEFKNNEKRDEFYALVKVHGADLWNALKECALDKDYPRINFYACDVKWYDSYVDVAWHRKLLDFASEFQGAGWRFMRVGEEMGDTEEETGGDVDLEPCDDFYFYQGMETPFNRSSFEPIGESVEEEQNA